MAAKLHVMCTQSQEEKKNSMGLLSLLIFQFPDLDNFFEIFNFDRKLSKKAGKFIYFFIFIFLLFFLIFQFFFFFFFFFFFVFFFFSTCLCRWLDFHPPYHVPSLPSVPSVPVPRAISTCHFHVPFPRAISTCHFHVP